MLLLINKQTAAKKDETALTRRDTSLFGFLLKPAFPVRFQAPVVTTREGKNDLRVEVSAPGFAKDTIKVSVKRDTLVVSGQRSRRCEDSARGCNFFEESREQFCEMIALDRRYDGARIRTEYKNGGASITVPKRSIGKRIAK